MVCLVGLPSYFLAWFGHLCAVWFPGQASPWSQALTPASPPRSDPRRGGAPGGRGDGGSLLRILGGLPSSLTIAMLQPPPGRARAATAPRRRRGGRAAPHAAARMGSCSPTPPPGRACSAPCRRRDGLALLPWPPGWACCSQPLPWRAHAAPDAALFIDAPEPNAVCAPWSHRATAAAPGPVRAPPLSSSSSLTNQLFDAMPKKGNIIETWRRRLYLS